MEGCLPRQMMEIWFLGSSLIFWGFFCVTQSVGVQPQMWGQGGSALSEAEPTLKVQQGTPILQKLGLSYFQVFCCTLGVHNLGRIPTPKEKARGFVDKLSTALT